MNLSRPPVRRSILLLWTVSVISVVYLSLSPKIAFPYEFDYADKVYHMLAYLWLSALPFLAFSNPRAALAGTLSMVPLGVALEFLQQYVPGRFFSPADMGANCLGVMVGIWLARYAKRLHFSRVIRIKG